MMDRYIELETILRIIFFFRIHDNLGHRIQWKDHEDHVGEFSWIFCWWCWGESRVIIVVIDHAAENLGQGRVYADLLEGICTYLVYLYIAPAGMILRIRANHPEIGFLKVSELFSFPISVYLVLYIYIHIIYKK